MDDLQGLFDFLVVGKKLKGLASFGGGTAKVSGVTLDKTKVLVNLPLCGAVSTCIERLAEKFESLVPAFAVRFCKREVPQRSRTTCVLLLGLQSCELPPVLLGPSPINSLQGAG